MLNFFFFFFNDTATTEIYTLSLHDALPISRRAAVGRGTRRRGRRRRRSRSRGRPGGAQPGSALGDRKSTRLNSSHLVISYAVFCLKKKKHNNNDLLLCQHLNTTLHIPLELQ